MEPVCWVYILRCADGSLYTGWTNRLNARIQAHNSGKGAKYTRSRRPVELVYCQGFGSRSGAMRREAQIKRMTRPQKEQLLAGWERPDASQGASGETQEGTV